MLVTANLAAAAECLTLNTTLWRVNDGDGWCCSLLRGWLRAKFLVSGEVSRDGDRQAWRARPRQDFKVHFGDSWPGLPDDLGSCDPIAARLVLSIRMSATNNGTTGSENGSSSHVPDPATELGRYLATLQGALQPPTRSAASLPQPSDIGFHRSIDKDVARSLDETTQQLAGMIDRIATWTAKQTSGKSKQSSTTANAAEGDDAEQGPSGSNGFSKIADIVDDLLEKSDICMDEYSGKVAPRQLDPARPSGSSASLPTRASTSVDSTQSLPKTGRLPPQILNAQIEPPQRRFTVKPDNAVDTPWERPLTMGKPNALVPLDWVPPPPGPGEPRFDPGITRQGMYCAEGDPRQNPYYYEIFNAQIPTFVYQPPTPEELTAPPPLDPQDPERLAGVVFRWIDSAEALDELVEHLKEDRVKEIAIDLEAHAYRSYQGIACLMQLSTRWGDYILDLLSDTVRLGTEKLNTAFTDPNKVKILHGAEHDVLWLQRDCGLYLVNLFDTYHATNVLGFPAHGLAYLLSKYYDFEADKRYQLADWRIRPLPKEMLYYARSDTHSLIYVYHRLRSDILTTGGRPAMVEVFHRSNITAARTYAKEVWDEEGNSREGWRSLWRRMGGAEALGTDLRPSVKQMLRTERLVRRLHRWRDEVAREEDESPRYILSAMNLINLASRAPMTKSEAMAVFTPGIQPLRKRAGQVANIIKTEVLAWEQDQKEASDAKKAELQRLAAGSAASAMDEDFGSVETMPVATPVASSSSAAAALPAVSLPQVSRPDLWAASPAPRAGQPLLRSKSSRLFGESSAGASVASSPAQSPAPSVQTSLLTNLRRLIGSATSSLLGGQTKSDSTPVSGAHTAEPEDSSVVLTTTKPRTSTDVIQSHTSLEKGADGVWRSAEAPSSAIEVGIGKARTSAADEPEDQDEDGDDSKVEESGGGDGAIVQVKKKKQDGSSSSSSKKKKKNKWSKAEKRKAKEERDKPGSSSPAASVLNADGGESQSNSSSTDKQAKKRRVDESESATSSSKASPIKPFDYSSVPSILDAPRPPRQGGSAGGKHNGKAKDKDKKGKTRGAAAPATGPERFADARQPKDRTTLGNHVGKSMTFK